MKEHSHLWVTDDAAS